MSVDDDTLRTELDRLVRPVDDVDGLVGQIERRRAQVHRRRSAVRLVAAASVLVLVGVAAVALATRGDDSEVVTAGPAPTDPERPVPTTASGPSVTVSTTGIGPLHITASELVPSENAWLEHTITIQNTGTETIYVDDHRTGGFLGDHELVVGDEGCGYGSGAEGEPVVAPACRQNRRDLVLEPGEQATSRISLWRDLPGLQPVTSETFEFRKFLRYDTHGFIDPERHPVEGEIVLTYEGLADAGASGGENAAPPSSIAPGGPGASTDSISAAGPSVNAAPTLLLDPPMGFEADAPVIERDSRWGTPVLSYAFRSPGQSAGGLDRTVEVTVWPVHQQLANIHDPVTLAEGWMPGVEFAEVDISGHRGARGSFDLAAPTGGELSDVGDAVYLRVGAVAVEIHAVGVDPGVVEALIARIDEAALERALATAG